MRTLEPGNPAVAYQGCIVARLSLGRAATGKPMPPVARRRILRRSTLALNALCHLNRIPLAPMLRFAVGLEQGAVNAYLGAVPLFGDRDLANAAASILGDEAMHSAILRQALGENPCIRALRLLSPSAMPLEPSAVGWSRGGAQTNTKAVTRRFQGGFTRTYAPLPDLSGIGADPSQLIR